MNEGIIEYEGRAQRALVYLGKGFLKAQGLKLDLGRQQKVGERAFGGGRLLSQDTEEHKPKIEGEDSDCS